MLPPSMGARGVVDRAEQQTARTEAAAETEDDGVGDTSLSENEEKQASKYRKMLKMGSELYIPLTNVELVD